MKYLDNGDGTAIFRNYMKVAIRGVAVRRYVDSKPLVPGMAWVSCRLVMSASNSLF
jgi:hypothetical protein